MFRKAILVRETELKAGQMWKGLSVEEPSEGWVYDEWQKINL